MRWTPEKYFEDSDEFAEIIKLGADNEKGWDTVSKLSPSLPKGWFELSKLEKSVRLEFIHDYWLNAFPPMPHFYAFLDRFFSKLKHLQLYLAQHQHSSEFKPYLVYVMDHTFFLGSPPMKEVSIDALSKTLDFPFPSDFLSFLRIHDGFRQREEGGIFRTASLDEKKSSFLTDLAQKGLFPFYCKSESTHYQCFTKEWDTDGEVGNVLYRPTGCQKKTKSDTLAYCTFTDWLMVYLEEASK